MRGRALEGDKVEGQGYAVRPVTPDPLDPSDPADPPPPRAPLSSPSRPHLSAASSVPFRRRQTRRRVEGGDASLPLFRGKAGIGVSFDRENGNFEMGRIFFIRSILQFSRYQVSWMCQQMVDVR